MSTQSPLPTSRKNFLTKIIVGWISLIILPMLYGIVEYIFPPAVKEKIMQTFTIKNGVKNIPPGTFAKIKFDKTPVIVLSSKEGQLKAFNARCTHLGCVVKYRESSHDFFCECHSSQFDTNGKNIAGPATKPLQQLKVSVSVQDITLTAKM